MKKILVIEDDPTLNKIYETKLKLAGYEVKIATNGDTGLSDARSFAPDLIILDLLLPKKDGFEVLTELKKNGATKHIKVLITSNLGEDDNVKKSMSLGAAGYVIKTNSSIGELVAKVKRLAG